MADEIEEVITIDGTRFMLRGSASLHVRPSGTEPVVRAYLDSPEEARTAELHGLAQEELQHALS